MSQPAIKVFLEAHPLDWAAIPAAGEAMAELLPLLASGDDIKVRAAANAIMQTAADIRLTATLRALNEKGT